MNQPQDRRVRMKALKKELELLELQGGEELDAALRERAGATGAAGFDSFEAACRQYNQNNQAALDWLVRRGRR